MPNDTSNKDQMMPDDQFLCGECQKAHSTFEAAGQCCQADFVICPMSALPPDTQVGHQHRHTYGKNSFNVAWAIVDNEGPLPIRVYVLPPVMCQLMDAMFEHGNLRYEQGKRDAQRAMRLACGLRE